MFVDLCTYIVWLANRNALCVRYFSWIVLCVCVCDEYLCLSDEIIAFHRQNLQSTIFDLAIIMVDWIRERVFIITKSFFPTSPHLSFHFVRSFLCNEFPGYYAIYMQTVNWLNISAKEFCGCRFYISIYTLLLLVVVIIIMMIIFIVFIHFLLNLLTNYYMFVTYLKCFDVAIRKYCV